MCPLAFLGLDETKSRQVNGLRWGEYSWPLSRRCPDPRYAQSQAGQRQPREVKKHIGPGVCLGFVVVVVYVWLFFLLFLVCLGKRLFFKLFNLLCVCLCWDICEGKPNGNHIILFFIWVLYFPSPFACITGTECNLIIP